MKNAGQLLAEFTQDGMLIESSQRMLIHEVVDFMIHHFGFYPSKFEQQMVARATISLFPYLRLKTSREDGTVSLIVWIILLLLLVILNIL